MRKQSARDGAGRRGDVRPWDQCPRASRMIFTMPGARSSTKIAAEMGFPGWGD
jgi:hypothetical protein